MKKGSGIALKLLQFFNRVIQFCCAAIVLGIFSYFLATLRNHNLSIDTWIRAVEGISGIAVVYTAFAALLLWCLAGHPITSFLAIVLDVCLIGGFVYIAQANRGGAGSCNGVVNTPFGTGDSTTNVVDNGTNGFTALPSLHQACQLETACFAVSIVAIFFFILSILVEVALARHRRKEHHLGPSPANNYTSGSSTTRGGLLGKFGRKRGNTTTDHNTLPTHATPTEMRGSYATEQTRVGTSPARDGIVHKKHLDPVRSEDAYVGAPESTHDTSRHGHGDPVTTTGAPAAQETGYEHVAPTGGTLYRYSESNDREHAATNPVAAMHFPAGNNRYDDGVYNSRN